MVGQFFSETVPSGVNGAPPLVAGAVCGKAVAATGGPEPSVLVFCVPARLDEPLDRQSRGRNGREGIKGCVDYGE